MTHLSDEALLVVVAIGVVCGLQHVLGSCWIRYDEEAGDGACKAAPHEFSPQVSTGSLCGSMGL